MLCHDDHKLESAWATTMQFAPCGIVWQLPESGRSPAVPKGLALMGSPHNCTHPVLDSLWHPPASALTSRMEGTMLLSSSPLSPLRFERSCQLEQEMLWISGVCRAKFGGISGGHCLSQHLWGFWHSFPPPPPEETERLEKWAHSSLLKFSKLQSLALGKT